MNDLVLTLRDGADRDAFGVALAEAFAKEMPDVGIIVTDTDDDAAYTLTYEDIEGDQQFFNILAFVILAGSAAAAVNLTPRRGLLTALGIGATIAVLVMLVAGIDSFVGAIVEGGEEATGGVPDRVIVDMDSVYPTGNGPVDAVLASSSISDGEAMLRVGGEFTGAEATFPAIVEFIDWNDGLFRPAIEEGDVPSGLPAVVISPRAATDLDVGVGDVVSVRLPQRTGPLAYSLETMELPVAGIHGHPFRAVTYMATDHAAVLGLEGLANVVSVVPAEGVEVGDLQAEFLEIGAVTSVQRADAMARLMEELMAQFVGILQLFQAIVLLLAVLIAFSAAAIAVDERRREHATMFSFGVRSRKVVRMLLVESATIGVVATIIGIIGGPLLLQYFMAASADAMPDVALPIIVTPGTILWAVFVGVVAVGLAPLLTAPRKLRKMDLPSTLRVME